MTPGIPTAFAPTDSAFSTCDPRWTPPSIKHIDPVARSVDDFRQLVGSGPRAVQLPPAVIRHHDARAANLGRTGRIARRHQALQTEMTVPVADHGRHIVPVHGRVEHLGEIAADR